METIKSNYEIFNDKSLLFPTWHKIASIRTRPRRIFQITENGYYYPITRQPICLHKKVSDRGDDTIKWILLQAAYKFMYDIAYVEVELINKTALKIYNGSIDINLPKNVKNDMLSIVIDEAFHAYVAIDFIDQVKTKTNEELVYSKGTVELELAMNKFIPKLPHEIQGIFEAICICIGENTLTKELFDMTKSDDLNPFFHTVMADHMFDEGRHAALFRKVLTFVWNDSSEEIKLHIGALLPDFLLEYLSDNIRKEWDEKILLHLNFSENEVKNIINDVYPKVNNSMLTRINPVARNFIDVLTTCGVLKHQPTKNAFVESGLI